MNRLKAYTLGVADAIDQKGQLSSGITWEDNYGWSEAYDRGANMGEAVWPVIARSRSTIAVIRATTHHVRNLLP